jgi:DNA-directed RNA polymerase subunit RPC12/RpoP
MHGARVKKQDFSWRCATCAKSTEPGWLWLGGTDYVQCPNCDKGIAAAGVQTSIEPTRKIFLPKVV